MRGGCSVDCHSVGTLHFLSGYVPYRWLLCRYLTFVDIYMGQGIRSFDSGDCAPWATREVCSANAYATVNLGQP